MQNPSIRAHEAEQRVRNWLEKRGWGVESGPSDTNGADLIAHDGGQRFMVAIKSLAEGRPDRVIPLLSQAILQAQAYAAREPDGKPMAVVYVEHATLSLYQSVLDFAERYAPADVAVGVLSGAGPGLLRMGGVDSLAIDDRNKFLQKPRAKAGRVTAQKSFNLFSDLNQ